MLQENKTKRKRLQDIAWVGVGGVKTHRIELLIKGLPLTENMCKLTVQLRKR